MPSPTSIRKNLARFGKQFGRFPQFAVLPGLLLFLTLWLITWIRLDYPGLVEDNYGYMQFLGREVLMSEPISGLMSLHMQPPLLNAVAAFDLWLTPGSHSVFAGVYLLLTVLCLWMVVDTLRLLNVPFFLRSLAGVIFALLPATVIYSLWSYNTTLTMFGVSLAIWGVAVFKERQIVGSAVSALGIAVAVLTRASFLWPFAVVWIGILIALLARNTPSKKFMVRILPSALCLVVVLSVQAHYFNQFGLVTMSSWSGENLAKALIQSGQLTLPSTGSDFGSSCQNSLLNSLRVSQAPLWDPMQFRKLEGCRELPSLADRGNKAWDESGKDGKGGFEGNHNWSEELVAGKQWQGTMTKVVLAKPSQIFRLALTSETGPRQSALGIYLGPAEDYSEVTRIREKFPLADLGGLLSLFFAPVSLFVGACRLLVRRKSAEQDRLVLAFAFLLIAYHVTVSTIAEYGEGMRFQAEIAPILLIVLISTLALVGKSSTMPASSINLGEGS